MAGETVSSTFESSKSEYDFASEKAKIKVVQELTGKSSVYDGSSAGVTIWLYALLAFIWICILFWAFIWFTMPFAWSHNMHHTFKNSGYLDGMESTWVLNSLPVLLLPLLAYLYLAVNRSKLGPTRSLPLGKRVPRFSRQLLLSGNRYLPTMSVGEMFWTAVIASLVIWHIARYAWRASKRIDSDHEYLHHHFPYAKHAWQAKLDAIALDIGWGAYVLIIPLFFPVSRSSPLLRASGVSFEQAINYHRWMGHATMWLILLHSVGYLIVWGLEGVLWQQVGRLPLLVLLSVEVLSLEVLLNELK